MTEEDAENIPLLLRALRYPDTVNWASQALARVGERAVSELIELLNSKEEEVSWRAADVLRRAGPKAVKALPALLDVLKHDDPDRDPFVLIEAAWALVRMVTEDGVLHALDEAIHDEGMPAWVRRHLTVAIGKVGTKAMPALLGLLGDQDIWVRMRAAAALTSMEHGHVAIPTLVDGLGEENETVREFAVRTLGTVRPRPEEAVHSLVEMLSKEKTFWIFIQVERALTSIHPTPADAVPALIRRAKDADENRIIRMTSLRMLSRIAPREADALREDVRLC